MNNSINILILYIFISCTTSAVANNSIIASHFANTLLAVHFLDPCDGDLIGTYCDDNDACTINDVYNSNCECEGVYFDTDQDGICDAHDLCDGFDDGYDEDNDTIPDGCDDCNNNLQGTACNDGDDCTINDLYDAACNCAGTYIETCDLPTVCESKGLNSSFEYIDHIQFKTINNISGNNGGYVDFKNLVTDINLGTTHNIVLIPGYASGIYKEGWNVWIDYNKDGSFDNERELVLSIVGQEKIHGSISIPSDDSILGLTRMRISMQYNNGADPCENVTFGEVEDYYINIIPKENADPCKELTFDDFESGYNNWTDGGSDCSRIKGNADSGEYSIRLRDNSSSSHLTSKALDLSAYNELTINFSYFANSMEKGEDFWLQLSIDGGDTYNTVKSWASDMDFENERRYIQTVVIDNIDFSDKTLIRFRCDASANADQVFIDDISVSACFDPNQGLEAEYLQEKEEIAASEFGSNNNSKTRQEKVEIKKFDIEFNTFPNPATDILSFRISKYPALSENIQIRLIDIHGKTINQLNISPDQVDYSIDVSNLEKGMYVIISENELGLLHSRKVMVMR